MNVWSGDLIQFQSLTTDEYTFNVEGTVCDPKKVSVPRQGTGLSEPLICNASEANQTVTVQSDTYNGLQIVITVKSLSFQPEGQTFYLGAYSTLDAGKSIIAHDVTTQSNCEVAGNQVTTVSQGYNLADDDSCGLEKEGDFQATAGAPPDFGLGPLQDNNIIDFQRQLVSGYTYSRALRPGSAAVDRIPLAACSAVLAHTVDLASAKTDAAVSAGDVVVWQSADDATVVFNDGEHDVWFVPVPAGISSREVQFETPGSYFYRVYKNQTRDEIATGTITVSSNSRQTDQRGVPIPQRGTKGTYTCDSGAVEHPRVDSRPAAPTAARCRRQPTAGLGSGRRPR